MPKKEKQLLFSCKLSDLYTNKFLNAAYQYNILILYRTLDDTDIFENEQPFSVQDLIKLGGFLNTFYFALLQQQQQQQQQSKDITSTTTTAVTLPPLPASVKSFRAAHRLLLQIYDLDVRHPYCPKDHWLLVSDPSMTKSALLALFNPSKQPAVQPFLDRLRQGDPVPLRILQLMPHTVPFKTRLTVFRDWVALDQANLMTAGSRALRVRRQNVLEDGYRGLGGLPPSGWKGNIRVKFVNELGKNGLLLYYLPRSHSPFSLLFHRHFYYYFVYPANRQEEEKRI